MHNLVQSFLKSMIQDNEVKSQKHLGFFPGQLSWWRAWQPTPVFLPGESHGQRSLVGYSPWGCKDTDATEAAELTYTQRFPDYARKLEAGGAG